MTSIQSKAGKTWCLLLALGGKDMHLWFDHFPLLEEWAKDRGATGNADIRQDWLGKVSKA